MQLLFEGGYYRISLNFPRTCHQAWAEWNKSHPWIVPTPCTCMIFVVGVAQRSLVQIAPQCAAKLAEIVIYDHLAVQNSWIYHDHEQISCSFWLNLLGAQCAYEQESVAIITVPALVLFPPSNYTCMLAHSEINSTHEKNSRKYGISFTEFLVQLLFGVWLLFK